MSINKFLTIDPLILETLNLNERRMNHILDILHGRDPTQHPKTQRNNKNSLKKNRTISTINQDQNVNLPPIFTVKARVKQSKQQPKVHRQRTVASRNLSKVKSNSSLSIHQSQLIKKYDTINDKNTPKARRYSNHSNLKTQKKQVQKKNIEQQLNLQEELNRVKEHKKQQIMKDYMLQKSKRNKTEQINQKDIYRFQIQSVVAELTPIQTMDEAEKRMRRLKRKHKHLMNFDKNYYIKMNQHDMISIN